MKNFKLLFSRLEGVEIVYNSLCRFIRQNGDENPNYFSNEIPDIRRAHAVPTSGGITHPHPRREKFTQPSKYIYRRARKKALGWLFRA